MHHKRGRAKNRRAGCLMCKYHKMNGWGGHKRSDRISKGGSAPEIEAALDSGDPDGRMGSAKANRRIDILW